MRGFLSTGLTLIYGGDFPWRFALESYLVEGFSWFRFFYWVNKWWNGLANAWLFMGSIDYTNTYSRSFIYIICRFVFERISTVVK